MVAVVVAKVMVWTAAVMTMVVVVVEPLFSGTWAGVVIKIFTGVRIVVATAVSIALGFAATVDALAGVAMAFSIGVQHRRKKWTSIVGVNIGI